MSDKVRVFKRRAWWHWWCPCCMGGDWHDDVTDAWRQARQHITAQHAA